TLNLGWHVNTRHNCCTDGAFHVPSIGSNLSVGALFAWQSVGCAVCPSARVARGRLVGRAKWNGDAAAAAVPGASTKQRQGESLGVGSGKEQETMREKCETSGDSGSGKWTQPASARPLRLEVEAAGTASLPVHPCPVPIA